MKFSNLFLIAFAALGVAGCRGSQEPPPVDPNAKAQIVDEVPAFKSEAERNAAIDAQNLPPEVAKALKEGAGKLPPPGQPPQASSGGSSTAPGGPSDGR